MDIAFKHAFFFLVVYLSSFPFVEQKKTVSFGCRLSRPSRPPDTGVDKLRTFNQVLSSSPISSSIRPFLDVHTAAKLNPPPFQEKEREKERQFFLDWLLCFVHQTLSEKRQFKFILQFLPKDFFFKERKRGGDNFNPIPPPPACLGDFSSPSFFSFLPPLLPASEPT